MKNGLWMGMLVLAGCTTFPVTVVNNGGLELEVTGTATHVGGVEAGDGGRTVISGGSTSWTIASDGLSDYTIEGVYWTEYEDGTPVAFVWWYTVSADEDGGFPPRLDCQFSVGESTCNGEPANAPEWQF